MKKVKKADGKIVEVAEDYALQSGESFDLTDQITSALEKFAANVNSKIEDLEKKYAAKKSDDDVEKKIESRVQEEVAKLAAKPADKQDFVPASDFNINTQTKAGLHKGDKIAQWCAGIAEWNRTGSLHEAGKKFAVMVEGTATLGGSAVPEDFDLVVRQQTGKYSAFGQFITPRPMIGDTLNLTRRTGSTTTYVVGENVATTASNMTTEAQTVTPKMIATEVTLSRQLLEDSDTIYSALLEDLGDSRGKKLDNDWLVGTGAASELCTGLFNLSDYQSVAAGDAAGITTANLTFDSLNNAVALTSPQLRAQGRLVWMFSPSVMGIIRSIKDNANRPIFQEFISTNADGSLKIQGSMFGFPVVESYSLASATAPGASVEFGGLLDPVGLTNAYFRKGMSIELVFTGTDSASNNLQTNYLATVYLRERLGITNFADLDVDGENHSICVLKTPA